jgi:hypothetical protein
MREHNSRLVGMHLTILFILSMAVVAGCADDDQYDYKLEETETRTWSASGISTIAALSVNGDVSVEASVDTLITCVITRSCYGKDRADAEQYIDKVTVDDSIAGDVLTITADMPDNSDRDYAADLEIFAPASVHLDLATTNGNLAAISTVDGAELATTNGNITSQNLEGGVSGQITSGNASCDLAVLAAGETAALLTTNGNIQLSVPSDVSATFDARTTNGTVQVTGFSSVSYTVNQPNHKSGIIGTPPGTAAIAITIANGNATIMAR